jgi:hypothetical protein
MEAELLLSLPIDFAQQQPTEKPSMQKQRTAQSQQSAGEALGLRTTNDHGGLTKRSAALSSP